MPPRSAGSESAHQNEFSHGAIKGAPGRRFSGFSLQFPRGQRYTKPSVGEAARSSKRAGDSFHPAGDWERGVIEMTRTKLSRRPSARLKHKPTQTPASPGRAKFAQFAVASPWPGDLQKPSVIFSNLQQSTARFAKIKNEPNSKHMHPGFAGIGKLCPGCAPRPCESNPIEPEANLQQSSITFSNVQQSSAPPMQSGDETNPTSRATTCAGNLALPKISGTSKPHLFTQAKFQSPVDRSEAPQAFPSNMRREETKRPPVGRTGGRVSGVLAPDQGEGGSPSNGGAHPPAPSVPY
jgi:hypothetical protein